MINLMLPKWYLRTISKRGVEGELEDALFYLWHLHTYNAIASKQWGFKADVQREITRSTSEHNERVRRETTGGRS